MAKVFFTEATIRDMLAEKGFLNAVVKHDVQTVTSTTRAVHFSIDPGGKTLLLYGTLDEYLSGEHDKMVKTVVRFLSDDKTVMEIHDLPIGEKNTKVLEVTYTRQK